MTLTEGLVKIDKDTLDRIARQVADIVHQLDHTGCAADRTATVVGSEQAFMAYLDRLVKDALRGGPVAGCVAISVQRRLERARAKRQRAEESGRRRRAPCRCRRDPDPDHCSEPFIEALIESEAGYLSVGVR